MQLTHSQFDDGYYSKANKIKIVSKKSNWVGKSKWHSCKVSVIEDNQKEEKKVIEPETVDSNPVISVKELFAFEW